MKNIILLLVSINFFFISSCKKDSVVNTTPPPEQLPAETQEGKNTFGCLVDGQVWLPKAPFPYSQLTSSYQSGVFILQAHRYGDTLQEHFFFSRYFNTSGQFILNSHILGMTYTVYNKKNNDHYEFYNDSLHTGIMTLTKLDTINGIISGTFFFSAIDSISQKAVNITDGRFDVRY